MRAPAAAAAVFYDCLIGIDHVSLKEKIWLTKNHSEEVVMHAIKVATHPLTIIKTTLIQTIKWACKEMPDIPQYEEEIADENKHYTEEMAKRSHAEHYTLEALSLEAYINPKANGKDFGLKYTEKGFKDLLIKALRERKFFNIRSEEKHENFPVS